MAKLELRVQIQEDIYLRYRVFCIKHRLSIPKQTQELLRKFLEVQEENDQKIEEIKRK